MSHADITVRKRAEEILSNANREWSDESERTHLLEEEICRREEAQQRLSWALQLPGGKHGTGTER